MPFDSWDDVLFWHGSLIGYTAGVKAACEDKKKSDLLLEMAEVQSKLEIEEMKNAKLRELFQKTWKWEKNGCYECPLEKECKVLCVYDGDCGMAVEIESELQELGIEVGE